jgi:GcrA cell cycle regulator
MDWTDEAIARLRALWDEGHSTAEIGRRMQVSKNAVVGKAHRLNLPARPSPIRRDAAASARAATPRRVTGPTLPPLSAALVEESAPQIVAAPVIARLPQPPAPRPAPVLRAVPSPRGRNVACCWPIGEPGTKSFRFCEAEAAGGKPYCGEHAQLAYVKVRDRRDEAVA